MGQVVKSGSPKCELRTCRCSYGSATFGRNCLYQGAENCTLSTCTPGYHEEFPSYQSYYALEQSLLQGSGNLNKIQKGAKTRPILELDTLRNFESGSNLEASLILSSH